MRNFFALFALLGILLPACPVALSADEAGSLELFPAKVLLQGRDASAQILVTRVRQDGRREDVTQSARFSPANPALLTLCGEGRVFPLMDGVTTLRVEAAGLSGSVAVEVNGSQVGTPVSFTHQVVPVLTRFGCNSGGCHGKLSGQNGFRLSLLGFDPDLDFITLVSENRGRRVCVDAPGQSLFVLKATGQVAHGGGRKIEPGSDEHRVLERWVAGGARGPSSSEAALKRLEVVPAGNVFTRDARQQMVVLAHYSDGRVDDVTRMAQYESNDPEVAGVDPQGVVRAGTRSGEAAVMARFSGRVEVFRARVPLTSGPMTSTFVANLPIDRAVRDRWSQLGLKPSPRAEDAVFIRRMCLDLTGTLPTPAEVAAFEADSTPDKDGKLADSLLARPEHAYYFAGKWADVLRVKRGNQAERAFGTFAFHRWLFEAVSSDMPYDRMTREILLATGDEERSPTTVWFKDLQTPDLMVDNLSQVFMGTRLQCAQCHHHPFERWSQDDYWGLAAFFGRLSRKNITAMSRGTQQQNNPQRSFYYNRPSGTVNNKRTGKPILPTTLDGKGQEIAPEDDPRRLLVDWLTSPENPFFAKAVANRYWAHFFSRGIVEPLDDMRVTNPPSNPALLDALASHLVSDGYSLRSLCKRIVTSGIYRLASEPVEGNAPDRQSFARYYPKRMSAEVLHDAVHAVAAAPASFPGLPTDRHAPIRAIMLPDESFSSYFLDVFGRPQRLSPCECERVSEANLAQVLHMLNSEEIQGKIGRADGRADKLAKDPRPSEEKVNELFVYALGHKPDPAKLKLALDHLSAAGKDEKGKELPNKDAAKKRGWENLLWALINTREFSWIR
ncbi:MAG: DUF1549 and DUF1553 domain-containing protein [Planctomycetota bacterium]|nr:DUF1549 and DUF1553 domain-containing protein [Planctomycetota bacterium]